MIVWSYEEEEIMQAVVQASRPWYWPLARIRQSMREWRCGLVRGHDDRLVYEAELRVECWRCGRQSAGVQTGPSGDPRRV